jgi:hypothetical protein
MSFLGQGKGKVSGELEERAKRIGKEKNYTHRHTHAHTHKCIWQGHIYVFM